MAGLLLKQTSIFRVLDKYLLNSQQNYSIKDNGKFYIVSRRVLHRNV